jgi:protein TonB
MIGRGRKSFGIAALWGAASLFAVAGHAAVAAIALNWTTTADSAPPAAPPVLMISLEPIVAPQVPVEQVAPGPQAADSMPEEEQKQPEKVVESEPDIPKLPEKKEEAVAMLPPPMPAPKPEIKPEQKPAETKKEERKKTERRVASRASAPASFDAPRAAHANAPAAGAARVPVAALASWKSELMAQLNRYKRYPSGSAGRGTATVAFSINRSGEVTSARLAHSSGDSALDQEAVALPRRASPLPKPPDGLRSGTIPLTVPIRFGH